MPFTRGQLFARNAQDIGPWFEFEIYFMRTMNMWDLYANTNTHVVYGDQYNCFLIVLVHDKTS